MKWFMLIISTLIISPIMMAQNSIVIFTDPYNPNNPTCTRNYTKLQSLVFGMKMKIKIKSGDGWHGGIYREPVVSVDNKPQGIIYAADGLSGSNISVLRNYVKGGGILVLFYTAKWSSQNELLQDLFNISISSEVVFRKNNGSFIYPSQGLPPFLENYKIMMSSGYDKSVIWGYLTTTGDGNEFHLTSGSSAKSRCVAYEYKIGTGRILFLPKGFGYSSEDYSEFTDGGNFMDDGQIDLSDNTEASKALMLWFKK